MTLSSSILPDGSRIKIRIADVRGRFTSFKHWLFAGLIGGYIALPVISVGDHPAILLDIGARRFYLFGMIFNSQDAYLIFFLLTGVIFVLFYITALLGRAWCGFACPQTVFLEGIFRRIERWIEGPRSSQVRLSKVGGWRQWTMLAFKHSSYMGIAAVISLLFISYFISMSEVGMLFRDGPSRHWTAVGWAIGIASLLYLDFAWFREQLCLIVCPYGRLQSVLIDDDTLVVGYDAHRGEPRGKKNDLSRGACINCRRCVNVCPTGIDIRNGLQMECVGCANCSDACDAIMHKIGQAPGLIRYDSLNGLAGKPRRVLRPRIYLYTALLVLGAGVFAWVLSARQSMDVALLRLPGAPYVRVDGQIRNQYSLHLVNKESRPALFSISVLPMANVDVVMPTPSLTLESMEDRQIPIFVSVKAEDFTAQFPLTVKIVNQVSEAEIEVAAPFLGPDSDL